MSEQLPKFEDLSAVQVCDIIATGIMGWRKVFHDSGEEDWRDEHGEYIGTRPFKLSEKFNPYESLDDCHLALGQVGKTFASVDYIDALGEIIQRDLGIKKSWREFVSEGFVFPMLMASPKQICETLLVAQSKYAGWGKVKNPVEKAKGLCK